MVLQFKELPVQHPSIFTVYVKTQRRCLWPCPSPGGPGDKDDSEDKPEHVAEDDHLHHVQVRPEHTHDGDTQVTQKQVTEQVLRLVHSSSICARHGLLQCKVVHKVHYTNLRLSRIYPNATDSCNRCKQSPADHSHMFWSCPRLATFWSEIFKTLSTAYDTTISPEPLLALFGAPLEPCTSRVIQNVLAFTTLLARRLILLKWKHSQPPSHGRWVEEVLLFMSLEKLRFSLNGSLNSFERIWRPLLNHIESLTSLC